MTEFYSHRAAMHALTDAVEAGRAIGGFVASPRPNVWVAHAHGANDERVRI